MFVPCATEPPAGLVRLNATLAGVTVTVLVPVQVSELVPVTVYVVVTVGEAVTVAPVVALSAVAGDQLYVSAPVAVRSEQDAALVGVTFTVGNGSIANTALPVIAVVHAPDVANTV